MNVQRPTFNFEVGTGTPVEGRWNHQVPHSKDAVRAAPEGGLWWEKTAEAQGTQGPTGQNPNTVGNERQPPNTQSPQTRISTLDVGR
ncbi:MAG: hypothetical protein DRJ61_05880 [Acidobacteria bacterium]|nr:MAG: hypothetical protein DRJ61_05880 [Acidobacteriota bacterium]